MLTLVAATLALAATVPAPDASYTFALRPGPAIVVTLTTAADADGITELAVDPMWGGVDNDGADIGDLVVTDSRGESLNVSHPKPTSWAVSSRPGETLTATYTIAATPVREARPRNDYRTRLREGFFQMHGELGLLFPSHLSGEAPRDFVVRWEGFAAQSWSVASSFGPGESPPPFRQRPDDFRHSLFIAGAPGAFNLLTRDIRGTTIGIAVARSDERTWAFTDGEFADLCEKIIVAERDFMRDWSDPWFLVTLTPEGTMTQAYSIGGTGVTNCFAMYCTSGLSLDPASHAGRTITRTLAHEYFHTWNGGKVPSPAPGGESYWLSEGFTNYFARRMLRHAGLWTDADVLRDLNEAIAEYDANPSRNAPNSRIAAAFWKDRDLGQLPYQRGDLIALAIDDHVRRRSNGNVTLDSIFIDLAHRCINGEPFKTADFLDLIAPHCEPAFVSALRAVVADGADVPLPQAIDDPSAALGDVQRRETEIGFDFEATKRERIIRGVKPGSAAARAGLRDGMTMKGVNINTGPTPSAEIKVAGDDGEIQTIRYEPLGPPVVGRAYQQSAGGR